MQQRNETDADACAYNDLALVKVDAADVSKVNPSHPVLGRPGRHSTPTAPRPASRVYSFGNSSLRGGVEAALAEAGRQPRHRAAAAGRHPVYTVTPGVPGDSGSAFLDAEGNALGTLSTLAIAPLAGSNGVGDLEQRARPTRSSTAASPACSWCRAPSRSSPIL